MELQAQLETTYAQQNMSKYLKTWIESMDGWKYVEAAADNLYKACAEQDSYVYQVKAMKKTREDLKEVHEWIVKQDLHKLLWQMSVVLMQTKVATVQAITGSIFNKVKLSNNHRTMLAIEHLLHAFDALPYVTHTITRGEECIFKLGFELPDDVSKVVNAQQFPLPLVVPPVASSNEDIGYHTFNEHIISGNRLKRHNKYVDLNHINRKNRVAFTWESRLAQLVDFEFETKRKRKKGTGRLETDTEYAKRFETYQQLKTTLPKRVAIMVKHGNRFFIAHKYDNRIRTYAKGHEFNYQSHKFIKASVQLDKAEPVKAEW